MNLDDLRKPFDPASISWRVGSTTKDKTKGMALAYIDARDVQDRLDAVCGVGGWQCRYVPMHDKKTVCEIGIFLEPGVWVWKADGAGDSDVEAEKGALSDAFKRAAVRWGIGRYLYDVESPWVELEPAGNSYKIKADQYARLRAALGGKASSLPPAPQAEKPRMTAAEWVDQASAALLAIATPEAMSKWLMANNAAIEKLRDTDRVLYNAINQKIANRNDELQRIAA